MCSSVAFRTERQTKSKLVDTKGLGEEMKGVAA